MKLKQVILNRVHVFKKLVMKNVTMILKNLTGVNKNNMNIYFKYYFAFNMGPSPGLCIILYSIKL